jgi:hypothetical protein
MLNHHNTEGICPKEIENMTHALLTCPVKTDKLHFVRYFPIIPLYQETLRIVFSAKPKRGCVHL